MVNTNKAPELSERDEWWSISEDIYMDQHVTHPPSSTTTGHCHWRRATVAGESPLESTGAISTLFINRDYVRGRGLRDVWASDATLIVRARVQTSGLAILLVRACGAETFVPWTLLERAGASCVFMLELNFHSGSSIYSSELAE
ncbi:hypothetical protein F2Q69_00034890 [Brassica cretica]|uniref:Uncharacterized protein n=1 Tax=Brassica cretica TaxID=69181 RepID=A0A8S9SNS3_BRACR|nr:hypothetical protein F2Q69_00034890 [Brassica cretica]